MKNATSDEKRETKSSQRSPDRSGSAKPQISREEIQKKMQAAGTPGAAHQVLKALEGEWHAEVTCSKDQDASPKVSHARATGRWILNSHFLQEEFHGDMFGKPFNGRWLVGYDNTKQKYTSVWMDDANTAITTTEGKGDNKVITLEGRTNCPVTGRMDLPMKQVIRFESPDRRVCEMYMDGEKSMEIVYTRQ